MSQAADKKSDHVKNILHGFFLSIGTTIAEPHTILPLIITYFGGGPILIGFFSSLLRGGAVIVQLYAAFYAQSYPKMMKYFRRVLIIRFLSWCGIGIAILVLGKDYPTLTLLCIGIGLFVFSFSAGFGAIYFREIIAKIFSHRFRGKTMSIRQFFSALGALFSGVAAGYILEIYTAPFSFGILFIVSSFVMALGYIAIGTVDEPIKEKVTQKENSFGLFLKNSFQLLKTDSQLRVQIFTFLFAYSYLFSLPFIIVDASEKININGTDIGLLITAQMIGAMLSNIVWARLSSRENNKLIAHITIVMTIIATGLAYVVSDIYGYMLIFLLVGASIDGNRIASGNLILLIAPEEKRPIYTALQTNIISFGMFFSLIGGVILELSSFEFLYGFTIMALTIAFFLSLGLLEDK